MTLASLLAGNPHVIVEVWYKEGYVANHCKDCETVHATPPLPPMLGICAVRMKKDVMLGMASVPMSVLLEDPSVDRYAAVYALVSYPGEKEKKTQVRPLGSHPCLLPQTAI